MEIGGIWSLVRERGEIEMAMERKKKKEEKRRKRKRVGSSLGVSGVLFQYRVIILY
jgi:cell division protein FtsB